MPIDVFYGKLNERGKYYFRRSRKGIIYPPGANVTKNTNAYV